MIGTLGDNQGFEPTTFILNIFLKQNLPQINHLMLPSFDDIRRYKDSLNSHLHLHSNQLKEDDCKEEEKENIFLFIEDGER